MATKNERNFTDEQIRQGRDGVIGLQSGTNKGASQVSIDKMIKSQIHKLKLHILGWTRWYGQHQAHVERPPVFVVTIN